jgi:hypothetical protein
MKNRMPDHSCEPFEENSFWKYYDKVAIIIRKPGFFYLSIGLMIFGTVLGVIAPYLD